jgi:hypothetical protein
MESMAGGNGSGMDSQFSRRVHAAPTVAVIDNFSFRYDLGNAIRSSGSAPRGRGG